MIRKPLGKSFVKAKPRVVRTGFSEVRLYHGRKEKRTCRMKALSRQYRG